MKKILLILMVAVMLVITSACGDKPEPETTVQETRYKVDYGGQKNDYIGAKDSYRPGEKVVLFYTIIASDTDYKFYLDDEELKFVYDANKGFKISFTMPDHDVKLELVTSNSMEQLTETADGKTEATTEDKTEAKTDEKKTEAKTDEKKTEAKVDGNTNDNADSSSGSDGPITVAYLKDANVDKDKMDSAVVYDDTYSQEIVIMSKENLSNFRIISLVMKDLSEDGKPTFEYEVLYRSDFFDKDKTLSATFSFYGDTPNAGIAYNDATLGTEKIYALYQSGKDGSLCLQDITDQCYEKISYDTGDILDAYSDVIMGYKTEPDSDSISFLVTDINNDGIMELLIYKAGREVTDVYGWDGTKAKWSLGVTGTDRLALFDDGMARILWSSTEEEAGEMWYKYDPVIAAFLPIVESRYTLDEDYERHDESFYSFGGGDSWDEIEENYKKYGTLPVWAYEWNDMIEREEYEASISKGREMESIEPKAVNSFEGF
jgi:hypothetical protein